MKDYKGFVVILGISIVIILSIIFVIKNEATDYYVAKVNGTSRSGDRTYAIIFEQGKTINIPITEEQMDKLDDASKTNNLFLIIGLMIILIML